MKISSSDWPGWTCSDPIYQPNNSTCCIRKRPNHHPCQGPTVSTTTATLTTAYHNPVVPPTTASSIIPAVAAVTTTGQNACGASPTTTLSILNLTTIDVYSVPIYVPYDRIFTSLISLVGHLRIRRTATEAPVPGTA
ncbi:hypothetical protein SprV_0100224900 [Sparganum proliferum]